MQSAVLCSRPWVKRCLTLKGSFVPKLTLMRSSAFVRWMAYKFHLSQWHGKWLKVVSQTWPNTDLFTHNYDHRTKFLGLCLVWFFTTENHTKVNRFWQSVVHYVCLEHTLMDIVTIIHCYVKQRLQDLCIQPFTKAVIWQISVCMVILKWRQIVQFYMPEMHST